MLRGFKDFIRNKFSIFLSPKKGFNDRKYPEYKIKSLTGQLAVEFIRNIRLKRAAQLLRQQKLTVAEVTYNVGFNDLQYFRTCFKKQFGLSPSEYMTKIDSDIDL